MIKKLLLADDSTEGIGTLLRLRLPWLILGLVFGSLTTLIISRFEDLLSAEVSLAFFIPLIVYLADAVGTQTETIYVRNLTRHRSRFSTYLLKELIQGIVLGVIFGILVGLFALVWLKSTAVATTVGLAMFLSIISAAVISLVIPTFLYKEHQDPAVGAGPFTTVIQDLISLLIYFLIATTIVLH